MGLEPLAIVGIGFRARDLAGPAQLWALLRAGGDLVGVVPPERWGDVYDPNPLARGKSITRWGAFLDDVEGFDWRFFGISPREARSMDPQHRLLLEVAWEALEDAGLPTQRAAGSNAGVFVGMMFNDYGRLHGRDLQLLDGYTAPNNTFAYAANRISFFFDLRGPSMALDANCSGSLLALHQACRSVWMGESEWALVGGASLILTPDVDISMSKASALSPTGRCRTWDARADGFVRGEGAGLVVIKPLEQAMRSGDRIYCVIAGTATNHTGRGHWIMEPSSSAQEEVIRAACAVAGIGGSDIDYVELHGTGTPRGDPIEAEALSAVVAAERTSDEPCRVGSIKTNLGHLDAAAGVAGLIKTALCLHHGELVPSLHFQTRNPAIIVDDSKIRVQTQLEPWPRRGRPPLAGVTSVGFGGTNVHVVLQGVEEAPYRSPKEREDDRCWVLPLSARSAEARTALAGAIADWLDAPRTAPILLSDVSYTLATRRTHHDWRLAVSGDSAQTIAAELRAFVAGNAANVFEGRRDRSRTSKLVFVFPGHGPQWLGMGRDLLELKAARDVIDECDRLALGETGWSIRDELSASQSSSGLERSDVVQPVLFSLAMALAALWRSWGVQPDMVIGHSFGELAAACVAGAISLEEGVRIVCARGRVTQQRAGAGGVALVELPHAEVATLLATSYPQLEVAGINSPTSTLVTGPVPVIEAFLAHTTDKSVFARRVQLAYAAHSRDLDGVLGDFARAMGTVSARPTAISVCSTVRGSILEGTALNVDYWVENLRKPVRFAEAIATVAGQHDLFLEISPHPVLLTPIEQTLTRRGASPTVISSLRRGTHATQTLQAALGRLYAAGFDPDWTKRYPTGKVLSVPTYPWSREKMWVETAGAEDATRDAYEGHPLLGRHVELSDGRTHVWDGTIGAARLAFARDHRLRGVPVLPASAFVEMFLAAAYRVLGTERVELRDVELTRALFLPEKAACHLQLQITREGDQWRAEVRSRKVEAGGEWRTHATAQVKTLSEGAPAAAAVFEPLGAKIGTRDCYVELHERGLDYGRAFRGIEWLSRRDDQVLACVRMPDGLDSSPYFFHPAFHDACMHAAVLALPCLGHSSFVPVKIRRITCLARQAPTVYSRATVSAKGERFVADVQLTSADGAILQSVDGLEFAHLDNEPDEMSSAELEKWLYEVAWAELPSLPTDPPPSVGARPARTAPSWWVVLTDTKGVGAALAEKIRGSGGEVLVLMAGTEYREIGATEIYVRAQHAEDMKRALASVGEGAFSGVVHLWSLDIPGLEESSAEDLDTCVLAGSGSAVHLLRALDDSAVATETPVWFVTRGAQAHGIDAADMAILQAPLWGFARAAALELPSRWGGLVDLDPRAAPVDSAAALWASLRATRAGEDEIVLRGQRAFGARLVRRAAKAQPANVVRSGVTYLVTGGTGGLGLTIARWLAKNGATDVVLTGRTPLPPREQWDAIGPDSPLRKTVQQLMDLERLGVRVQSWAFDIANANALRQAMSEHVRRGLPPIGAVFHLAGTVRLESILALDRDKLLDPIRPKLHGALALHRALPEVDNFVLFSSASAVIRSPRLAHYAAGNAFLDALAHYRHAKGQAASSIDWGLWGEVGYIERLEHQGPAAIRGARTIAPHVGTRVLEMLNGAEDLQTLVWPSDWEEWAELYPAFARRPFLSHLLRGPVTKRPSDHASLRGELVASPPAERRALLLAYVITQVCARLNLRREQVPETTPLDHLGFDSLQATELQARVRQDLDIQIPVVRFLGLATVQTITDFVLERITSDMTQAGLGSQRDVGGERRNVARSGLPPRLSVEEADTLGGQVDELSGESLDALLERLVER